MFRKRNYACWVLTWAAACAPISHALAHGVKVGALLIDHPYATPSLKGSMNASVYFRGIQNKGDQLDRLVAASSPLAERVVLYRMAMLGSTMQMREVPVIDLPPDATTPMRHKGSEYHLMLMGLKQPLKNGDRFDITLTFAHAGTQAVNVWVQTPRDAESPDHPH